jgi:hypothetical protein
MTDMLLSQLGDDGLASLTRALGSNPQATKAATATAIPLLFSALAKNASTTDGAAALAGALDRDHDGGALGDLASAFSQDSHAEGEGILKHVLGGRRADAESGIAAASGLDPNQTAAMLAKLAPLVMGALGKAKRANNLDSNGVTDLLRAESGDVQKKLGGLAGLLDRDGDGSIADDLLGGIAGSLFGRGK